jgi:hypothetical protein
MIPKALYASRFVRVGGVVLLASLAAGAAFSHARGKHLAATEQGCAIDSTAAVKSCCTTVPQSRAKAFTAPAPATKAADGGSSRPPE